MTKLFAAALCGFLFATLTGFAGQWRLVNGTQWIYGIGQTETCGMWRFDRPTVGGRPTSPTGSTPVDAWIVGFVSGAGWLSGSLFQSPPQMMTTQSILDTVDHDCAQDPTAKIADMAAKAFMSRVRQKSGAERQ
jgi:hypothetical protein